MPTSDPGNAISSGTTPITGAPVLPIDAIPMPMPMPIAPGELHPGGEGRLRIIAGTEGDDRLVLDGGFAVGGEGDDTFVLTSTQGDADEPENLGTILDFQAGDKLDLSQLGDKAAELGRAADAKGGQRVSIDYDGDGKEDGFVIVHERGEIAPDDTGVVSPGDGGFHILPFPMPGDGEVTIVPTAFSLDEAGVAGAVTVGLRSMSMEWIA
ncbi:MAG: hypothetical protein KKE02_02980 [Alphaproteobacteria bacterium]|nr:hypothetical protein [Alphaproteobacteria bacterium]MBU1513356.1 hypothetical protein [Alphaproteobacteria bacterium]MBU2096348.1 hypothetical protein [Alphaproteobacteria bacterium]MBU2149960.1 hypothetical protein [Alphaproteobacteria bacterium]MBU2309842.1 hypothetical protein [Alphaproteobacteria bacterium]